jgi:transposase
VSATGGGERAAGILSLIEIAKLSGIHPEAYLHNALTKIAELLPWNLESTFVTA